MTDARQRGGPAGPQRVWSKVLSAFCCFALAGCGAGGEVAGPQASAPPPAPTVDEPPPTALGLVLEAGAAATAQMAEGVTVSVGEGFTTGTATMHVAVDPPAPDGVSPETRVAWDETVAGALEDGRAAPLAISMPYASSSATSANAYTYLDQFESGALTWAQGATRIAEGHAGAMQVTIPPNAEGREYVTRTVPNAQDGFRLRFELTVARMDPGTHIHLGVFGQQRRVDERADGLVCLRLEADEDGIGTLLWTRSATAGLREAEGPELEEEASYRMEIWFNASRELVRLDVLSHAGDPLGSARLTAAGAMPRLPNMGVSHIGAPAASATASIALNDLVFESGRSQMSALAAEMGEIRVCVVDTEGTEHVVTRRRPVATPAPSQSKLASGASSLATPTDLILTGAEVLDVVNELLGEIDVASVEVEAVIGTARGILEEAVEFAHEAIGDEGRMFEVLYDADGTVRSLRALGETETIRAAGGRHPVVFVHGWEPWPRDVGELLGRRGWVVDAALELWRELVDEGDWLQQYWGPLLELPTTSFATQSGIRPDLDARIAVYAFLYDTMQGIDRSGRQLRNWLHPDQGEHLPIFITHSMGALVTRYALEAVDGNDRTIEPGLVFSLGGPHHGTVIANAPIETFGIMADALDGSLEDGELDDWMSAIVHAGEVTFFSFAWTRLQTQGLRDLGHVDKLTPPNLTLRRLNEDYAVRHQALRPTYRFVAGRMSTEGFSSNRYAAQQDSFHAKRLFPAAHEALIRVTPGVPSPFTDGIVGYRSALFGSPVNDDAVFVYEGDHLMLVDNRYDLYGNDLWTWMLREIWDVVAPPLPSPPPPAPDNRHPTANAGTDRTTEAGTSTGVTATVSDADGLTGVTYRWTRLSGPAGATLLPGAWTDAGASPTTSASANLTFSASTPGTYVCRLEVSDGEASRHDDVTITVQSRYALDVTVTSGGASVSNPRLRIYKGALEEEESGSGGHARLDRSSLISASWFSGQVLVIVAADDHYPSYRRVSLDDISETTLSVVLSRLPRVGNGNDYIDLNSARGAIATEDYVLLIEGIDVGSYSVEPVEMNIEEDGDNRVEFKVYYQNTGSATRSATRLSLGGSDLWDLATGTRSGASKTITTSSRYGTRFGPVSADLDDAGTDETDLELTDGTTRQSSVTLDLRVLAR